MTALAMMEGRRVTQIAPYDSSMKDESYLRQCRRGSAMLRDAILLAKGIAPPSTKDDNREIPKPRVTALRREACPYCRAPTKPRGPLIAHIQATVAAYYGIHPNHMRSAQRTQSISHPRQVAMFLASELTPQSLPEIGRRFGGRDHTTVIHAIKVVRARIASNPEIEIDVEVLRERLAA